VCMFVCVCVCRVNTRAAAGPRPDRSTRARARQHCSGVHHRTRAARESKSRPPFSNTRTTQQPIGARERTWMYSLGVLSRCDSRWWNACCGFAWRSTRQWVAQQRGESRKRLGVSACRVCLAWQLVPGTLTRVQDRPQPPPHTHRHTDTHTPAQHAPTSRPVCHTREARAATAPARRTRCAGWGASTPCRLWPPSRPSAP
jgi:hypothetical protein